MKEAIEKAIEGGWNKDWYFSHFNGDEVAFGDVNKDSENNPCYYKDKNAILLDPLFWQSLGKALGWGRLHCDSCGEFAKPVREKESDPEYWRDCCSKKKLDYGKSFVAHWHRFIDHIAQGGDCESFFKELLKHKN